MKPAARSERSVVAFDWSDLVGKEIKERRRRAAWHEAHHAQRRARTAHYLDNAFDAQGKALEVPDRPPEQYENYLEEWEEELLRSSI
jgi:hypothetical protein